MTRSGAVSDGVRSGQGRGQERGQGRGQERSVTGSGAVRDEVMRTGRI